MLLYETLSQPLIFLIIFSIGFASGLIFDLRKYVCFLWANNKIVSLILDIIATLLVCGILFYSNLIFNYGQFRFFVIFSFVLGFALQRFILGVFVAKICSWCYNKSTKLMAKIYGKIKKEKKSITED